MTAGAVEACEKVMGQLSSGFVGRGRASGLLHAQMVICCVAECYIV